MQKVKKSNVVEVSERELRFIEAKTIEMNVASEAILDCIKDIIKRRNKSLIEEDKTIAEVIKKWEMK